MPMDRTHYENENAAQNLYPSYGQMTYDNYDQQQQWYPQAESVYPDQSQAYNVYYVEPYNQQSQEGFTRAEGNMGIQQAQVHETIHMNNQSNHMDSVTTMSSHLAPAPPPKDRTIRSSTGGPLHSLMTSLNSKPRRYCCGCFSSRKSCCWFWSIFITLALALMVGLAIFLWPKYPSIWISEPYVPPNASGLQISNGDPSVANIITGIQTATNTKPFSFFFDIAVNITVYSPNQVSIGINRIDFNGILLDANGSEIKTVLATGNTTNVVIQKMSNTTIVLPITLKYTTTSPAGITSDAGLALLIQSCSQQKPLRMSYVTELSINAISWTGYRPSVRNVFSIQCPGPVAASIASLSSLGTSLQSLVPA